jgi:solute carrier family 35 (UDP-galactose transporter), member B1
MCLEEKHDDKTASTPTTKLLSSTTSQSVHTSKSLATSTNTDTQRTALKLVRLTICALGICICYICYGIFHEQLFHDERSNHIGPSFILFTQCVTNVVVALVWQRIQSSLATTKSTTAHVTTTRASVPHALLFATSICYVVAMVCSNEAIPHVSYPVAVLAKSCKLIPTMIIGQSMSYLSVFFVTAKPSHPQIVYNQHEWVAAFCISMGIVLFHYNSPTFDNVTSSDHSRNHDRKSIYGMYLLGTSLFMDGILSSCQSFLKKCSRPPTAVETMLYINFYALFSLGIFCWITGQFHWMLESDSLSWTMLASVENGMNGITSFLGMVRQYAPTIRSLFILNVAAACGQIFIFLTITWFTPVITTMITTTRKFITILLSVLLYGHSFSTIQWFCIVFIFIGLYIAVIGTTTNTATKTLPQPQVNKVKDA